MSQARSIVNRDSGARGVERHFVFQARRTPPGVAHTTQAAFTLLETMIAVGLFVMIIGGSLGVYTMCQRTWHKTSLAMEVSHDVNMALSLMTYGYGTNNGLRSATTIIVDTNVLGCWVTASTNPQAASDSDHFMLTNVTKNRSFRILFSNAYDGMKWLDYNRLASNIVYFPVIGQDNKRVLICNYVKDASATNKGDGVSIQFTVSRGRGMFSVTNTVSTFINKRL